MKYHQIVSLGVPGGQPLKLLHCAEAGFDGRRNENHITFFSLVRGDKKKYSFKMFILDFVKMISEWLVSVTQLDNKTLNRAAVVRDKFHVG